MNRVLLALASVMALPALATAQPNLNVPETANPARLVPDIPENAVRYFVQQISEGNEFGVSVAVAGVPIGFLEAMTGWTRFMNPIRSTPFMEVE
jgi:hypothetical protein